MSEQTKIPGRLVVLLWHGGDGMESAFFYGKHYGARVFDAAQKQVNTWAATLGIGDCAMVDFIISWDDEEEGEEIVWEGELELGSYGSETHPDTYDLRAQTRHIIEQRAGTGEPWFYGQLARLRGPWMAELLAPTEEARGEAIRLLERYELPEYGPMGVVNPEEVR